MGGGSVNLWYVSEGLGLQVVAGHRVEGNFCLVSLTQELVITLSSLDLVQVWSGVSRGQAVCIASLPTTGGVQAMIESDIYNTALLARLGFKVAWSCPELQLPAAGSA